MNELLPIVPFAVPRHPNSISLAQAKVDLPPEEFRVRLRRHMQDHPGLTLAQVGRQINVTRQRVGAIVGRLNRPTCAVHDKPAPKRDAAAARLWDLVERVQGGEPAVSAAASLGISLAQASKLGFKARAFRSPAHGSGKRQGCNCWRCRRAIGLALPRGPKSGARKKIEVLDWSAWVDPFTGDPLRQIDIAKLAKVAQPFVSKIVREVAQG